MRRHPPGLSTGVDPGLALCDAYRAGRDAGPRRVQPGCGETVREAPEVREPRCEPDHVDQVVDLRVEADYLIWTQPGVLCDPVEVWSKLSAVQGRDKDDPWLLRRALGNRSLDLGQPFLKVVARYAQSVVLDQERAVGWDQVDDPGDTVALDGRRQ